MKHNFRINSSCSASSSSLLFLSRLNSLGCNLTEGRIRLCKKGEGGGIGDNDGGGEVVGMNKNC